jgi:hypothetical protein
MMKGRRTPDFWDLLREWPDLMALAPEWRAALGGEYEVVRGLMAPTSRLSRAWPCGLPNRVGCYREIIVYPNGDLGAFCPEGRCERVALRPEDRVLVRLEWRKLARLVARALSLPEDGVDLACGESERAWRRGAHVRVGLMTFDSERVVFYLTRSDDDALESLLHTARRREGDVAVAVLLPVERHLGVAARDLARSLHMDILPLDRIAYWNRDGHFRLDLGEYVYQRRLPVPDPGYWLWPRYPLVLDPLGNRYWYQGIMLQFPKRGSLPQRFLECLAANTDVFVSRKALCSYIWPSTYPDQDGVFTPWDRKVRGLKKKVDDQMKCIGGESIIEAVSGGMESKGGYRLLLRARDVAWWTEPDSKEM